MTPEEFRNVGHRLIDWIADYRAPAARDLPVMARTAPGEIKAQLPAVAARAARGLRRDLPRPRPDHPARACPTGSTRSFFGYFPSNASLASVLGDYLSTGLGVLGLSWQSSPALTELEEVVTDWMRQMVGLSDAWSGVIQDTASTSTLVALLCARERTTDYGLGRGGLQAEGQPLVVYTSDQAHSSVEKAALLAGFGRDNVRLGRPRRRVRDAPGRAGRGRSARTSPQGKRPCAVVATTGTTDLDRARPGRGDRPASPGGTASGCTSTPRWPARR